MQIPRSGSLAARDEGLMSGARDRWSPPAYAKLAPGLDHDRLNFVMPGERCANSSAEAQRLLAGCPGPLAFCRFAGGHAVVSEKGAPRPITRHGQEPRRRLSSVCSSLPTSDTAVAIGPDEVRIPV